MHFSVEELTATGQQQNKTEEKFNCKMQILQIKIKECICNEYLIHFLYILTPITAITGSFV